MDDDVMNGDLDEHAKAGPIKAIDKGSVHRICSGQVVLTLATAVKELVENSIDAGATIIDVKLKEYGSESVEVVDNGSGVHEKNFSGLTLKHHTSKLQDFSDLVNVNTFGFRGEALSSLCALSDLSVVTRHSSSTVGTKLEFDYHGRITNQIHQARQMGTTVTLLNLFSTLPVRHKEFQRNLKKEFAKMVQVLNSYCIISTGVRINCSNQTSKGNRSTVVSSKGNNSMKENISNVFGSKQLLSLVEFRQVEPDEEVCTDYGIKLGGQVVFRIQGFISSCTHGRGRSSSDRQFYFINSRPCDSTKLSKAVNDVYHQFNRHQYPFVALHITMDKEAVDVNVTPDKRQIFLQDEKLLLATIKMSLLQLYEPTSSVFQLNNTSAGLQPTVHTENKDTNRSSDVSVERQPKPSLSGTFSKLKRSFGSAFAKDEITSPRKDRRSLEHASKQRKLDMFVSKRLSQSDEIDGSSCYEITSAVEQDEAKNRLWLSCDQSENESGICSSQESSSQSHYSESFQNTSCSEDDVTKNCSQSNLQTPNSINEMSPMMINNDEYEGLLPQGQSSQVIVIPHTPSEQSASDKDDTITECSSNFSKTDEMCADTEVSGKKNVIVNENTLPECEDNVQTQDDDVCGEVSQKHSSTEHSSPNIKSRIIQYDKFQSQQKKEMVVNVNMESLRSHVSRNLTAKSEEVDFCRNFRAKINPSDNQSAEEELRREIKKDMFSKMEILGQFNLGFIIAKNGDDLFIVDQHATDEKYNFEMLQRHTVIQSQKLIQPQNLELTASNETILMDNLEIFQKNGFEFLIDEEGQPTQRVKLISTPISKNWNFGKEDIEELIFMLTESPGIMCRPTRVRQMFASRSCRKSIMIGTALKHSEMKKLVSHMGEIEQPWNCPHGRPTMRHLINLNMVPK